MRSILYILITGISLSFSGCRKAGPDHKIYVYSTQPPDYSVTKMQLYVSDDYKGEIPYIQERLWFGDDSLEAKALIFTLGPGKSMLTAKDQFGYVKTEGELKLKKNSASATSVIGNINTRARGNDVIIEISRN
jgi:hypothetical protein